MQSQPSSAFVGPQQNRNNLILEIHDKFDFERQNEEQNPTSDSLIMQQQQQQQQQRASSIANINNTNNNNHNDSDINGRLALEKHLARMSISPGAKQTSSYLCTNLFDENGYVFDGVKIDIEDIDNTSLSNMTTQSLKRCKSQVLKHYYNLLCFQKKVAHIQRFKIGWRPFYKEHFYRIPFVIRIINFLYPLMIMLLLFYAYGYDIITCQGKLNVAYDTQFIAPATLVPAFTRALNASTTATPQLVDVSDYKNPTNIFGLSLFDRTLTSTKKVENNQADKEYSTRRQDQCGHVVTTYILPSIMHFIAYILGFIYFRINENEQLYALMEKVFLAVNQTMKDVSQDKVIRRLKVFIIFGVFWVILAMCINILSRVAFGSDKVVFYPQWASITLEAISLIIMNSVFLAVVINHATQCEMIIFYVEEIKTRLEEKSITLKEAMHQILDIRIAITNLNSTVSKMNSLVSLIFAEKFIIGLIILILNRVFVPLAWVYRILFTVSWLIILAFTLIQIARLNSLCCKFKLIALSARVYGYHASTRDELDSFLLFASSAKLRAKLWGIDLQPSVVIGTSIIFAFTLIILFQTSVISTPDSYI